MNNNNKSKKRDASNVLTKRNDKKVKTVNTQKCNKLNLTCKESINNNLESGKRIVPSTSYAINKMERGAESSFNNNKPHRFYPPPRHPPPPPMRIRIPNPKNPTELLRPSARLLDAPGSLEMERPRPPPPPKPFRPVTTNNLRLRSKSPYTPNGRGSLKGWHSYKKYRNNMTPTGTNNNYLTFGNNKNKLKSGGKKKRRTLKKSKRRGRKTRRSQRK